MDPGGARLERSGDRGPAGEDRAAEQVEQLLREAHLLRMRENHVGAEERCRQALSLKPEEPSALEMLGDLLQRKGELEAAETHYRRALELQPDRGVLEEKVARVVLRRKSNEMERAEAMLLLSSPREIHDRKRNALMATLLAIPCPGVGHLFLGQYWKGFVLLALGLLCLGFGGRDTLLLLFILMGVGARGDHPNPTMVMLGVVGFAVYVYSLIDAGVQARKTGRSIDV